METFLKKLDRLLRDEFHGATTQLERWEPPRTAGGFLIWEGFKGIDPRDRVKRVYDALRDRLHENELGQVALIMPVTPIEMKVRKEQLEIEEQQSHGLSKSKSS
jgi:hypothetical protein